MSRVLAAALAACPCPVPGTSLKRESFAGRGRAQPGGGRVLSPGRFAGGPRPLLCPFVYKRRGCRKPHIGGGTAQKALPPLTPHQKRPEPRCRAVCPGIFAKHPSTEAPGAGASLGAGGGITCVAAAGAALGPETRGRRQAVPALALAMPCLPLPGRLLPAQAKPLCRSPAAAAAASRDRGASGCTEKFVSNFPVFSLFPAFSVCFVGSQVLNLVALFR